MPKWLYYDKKKKKGKNKKKEDRKKKLTFPSPGMDKWKPIGKM